MTDDIVGRRRRGAGIAEIERARPLIVQALAHPETALHLEGMTERAIESALAGSLADWIAAGAHGSGDDLRALLIERLEFERVAIERIQRGERGRGRPVLPEPPLEPATVRRGQFRGVPRSYPLGERPATFAKIPPPDDPRFQRLIRDLLRDARRTERDREAERKSRERDRRTEFRVERTPAGTAIAGPRRKRRGRRGKRHKR